MLHHYSSATTITVNGKLSSSAGRERDFNGRDTVVGAAVTNATSMVTHNMSNSLATLCNIGNSCYMNSVLYTLRFAPNFTHNLHHLVEFLELVLQRAKGAAEQSKRNQPLHSKQKSSSLGRNVSSDGASVTGHSWSSKDLASFDSHAADSTTIYSSSSSTTVPGADDVSDGEKCCSTRQPHALCTRNACSRLREAGKAIECGGAGVKNNRQLVCETLHGLFHSLTRNEAAEAIEPFHAGGLLQAVQNVSSTFEGNQQQDAHEFLMCLLDSVRESCQTLNKTLFGNPDILTNSPFSLAEKPPAATVEPPHTNSNVVPAEPKSTSTQFLGRNLFRRRKESLKAAVKPLVAKEETKPPVQSVPGDAPHPPVAPTNATDATAAESEATKQKVDADGAEPSAAEERMREVIRKMGLDFFGEDFEGVTVSRTRCLSCETVTEQKETMIDIAIPITSSEIGDSIKNPQQFFQDACITREYFRGDNKYRCEVCFGYTEACRTISFDVLPRLLVLQLKRFNGDMEKINSYIPTPFVLQCFCRDCYGRPDGEKRHLYRLYSVITHVGARMSVGHYIAYTAALENPLLYSNCAKDRQRRVLAAGAQPLDGQPATGGDGGAIANGVAPTVGLAAAEKSTSGQLKKKLFRSKKASSAGDISKKFKNNVINRFAPSNGTTESQEPAQPVPTEKARPAGSNDNFYSASSILNATCNQPVGTTPDVGELDGVAASMASNIADMKLLSLNGLSCQSIGCCAVLSKAHDKRQPAHGADPPGYSCDTEHVRPSNGYAAAAATATATATAVLSNNKCDALGCPQQHHHGYGLGALNGETQPAAGGCPCVREPTSAEADAREPLQSWYMCDDDKIKIMTQQEFEEILDGSRARYAPSKKFSTWSVAARDATIGRRRPILSRFVFVQRLFVWAVSNACFTPCVAFSNAVAFFSISSPSSRSSSLDDICSASDVGDALEEEGFGDGETGVTAGHAAEEDRRVLLAHTGRAVDRPVQEALDQPDVARTRQRPDDHDLLRADVALQVAAPEEAPLRFVTVPDRVAVHDRAQVERHRVRHVRARFVHPPGEQLDGAVHAVTHLEPAGPGRDQVELLDRIQPIRRRSVRTKHPQVFVDRLHDVLDVALEHTVQGRSLQQPVDVVQVGQRRLPRYVVPLLAQVVHHRERDAIVLLSRPRQVHRVVYQLGPVEGRDPIVLRPIQLPHDQPIVRAIVLHLVQPGELQVKDHPVLSVRTLAGPTAAARSPSHSIHPFGSVSLKSTDLAVVYVSGIHQQYCVTFRSPAAPDDTKRVCVTSAVFASVHESITFFTLIVSGRTPFACASSVSASHRLSCSALPYACRRRYRLTPSRNVSSSRNRCIMRITTEPFSYEMASKICEIWFGWPIATETGWLDSSASNLKMSSAFETDSSSSECHSGWRKSTPRLATYVAKPSFSHRSVHQRIVTRLPNHWWASSCAMTDATRCLLLAVDTLGWYSSAVSRYVIKPQFSIAPDAKSEARHARPHVRRVLHLIDRVPPGPDPERHIVRPGGRCLPVREIVHRVRDQVGGHRHGRVELIEHPPRHRLLQRARPIYRHVAERGVALLVRQRDRERRLHRRLVEARERLPGVRRLELRHRQPHLLLAALVQYPIKPVVRLLSNGTVTSYREPFRSGTPVRSTTKSLSSFAYSTLLMPTTGSSERAPFPAGSNSRRTIRSSASVKFFECSVMLSASSTHSSCEEKTNTH
uniref:USP domain-containing protein n=1 Tax=Anopheles farauti TaxID=69004 RepID=A0A182QGM6_9DIPT